MASARTPQSQQDWRSILKRRSAELAPGGRFVFVNFCESTDGYYLGNTDRGANMYSTFAELWRELQNRESGASRASQPLRAATEQLVLPSGLLA